MSERIIKVCVDAGHCYSAKTGGDPGAVNGSHYEAIATLAIAKKLKKKLETAGYQVKMTRTGGAPDLTLAERCRISNSFGADVFVSIHLNAAESRRANGLETWRYANVGERTKDLADNVQAELIGITGAVNRGVKTTTAFYVLKHTKASAVLVETGFISNSAECRKLFNRDYQDRLAEGIFKGILKTIKP